MGRPERGAVCRDNPRAERPRESGEARQRDDIAGRGELRDPDDGGGEEGEADGVFGSRTVSAVTAFQLLHGVHVDNVVGPVTWMTLDSAVADRSAL